MTKEELKNKCKERARIFQQAMESCKSSSPIDCIEWFADRIAELERKLEQTGKDLSDYQFNYPTIKELQKENAELTCQMKRNTYCYSCTNATDKCYRKEIGCPCGDYKFYKDEITELRKLKRECETSLCRAEYQYMYERFAKAKDLLAKWVELYNPKLEGFPKTPVQVDTEKFLKEI